MLLEMQECCKTQLINVIKHWFAFQVIDIILFLTETFLPCIAIFFYRSTTVLKVSAHARNYVDGLRTLRD